MSLNTYILMSFLHKDLRDFTSFSVSQPLGDFVGKISVWARMWPFRHYLKKIKSRLATMGWRAASMLLSVCLLYCYIYIVLCVLTLWSTYNIMYVLSIFLAVRKRDHVIGENKGMQLMVLLLKFSKVHILASSAKYITIRMLRRVVGMFSDRSKNHC
jgi:hypothetical protein